MPTHNTGSPPRNKASPVPCSPPPPDKYTGEKGGRSKCGKWSSFKSDSPGFKVQLHHLFAWTSNKSWLFPDRRMPVCKAELTNTTHLTCTSPRVTLEGWALTGTHWLGCGWYLPHSHFRSPCSGSLRQAAAGPCRQKHFPLFSGWEQGREWFLTTMNPPKGHPPRFTAEEWGWGQDWFSEVTPLYQPTPVGEGWPQLPSAPWTYNVGKYSWPLNNMYCIDPLIRVLFVNPVSVFSLTIFLIIFSLTHFIVRYSIQIHTHTYNIQNRVNWLRYW